MKISAFLIDKRKEKKFTQAQVAEMAEISRAYYTQIETEIKRPSPDVAQKIANRPGGYTRILKLGNRLGDNAEMCMIELVDYNTTYTEVKKEEAKKTTRRRRPSAKKEAAPAATEETQVAEAPVTEEAPKAE
mgnify:CR=1 FL=1